MRDDSVLLWGGESVVMGHFYIFYLFDLNIAESDLTDVLEEFGA